MTKHRYKRPNDLTLWLDAANETLLERVASVDGDRIVVGGMRLRPADARALTAWLVDAYLFVEAER